MIKELQTWVKDIIRQSVGYAMDAQRDEMLEAIEERLSVTQVFCYTEAEAAEKLHISQKTLKRLRDAGEISHSYATSSTVFCPETGKPLNGRPVYKPEHIESYLKRHEIRYGNAPLEAVEFPRRKAS